MVRWCGESVSKHRGQMLRSVALGGCSNCGLSLASEQTPTPPAFLPACLPLLQLGSHPMFARMKGLNLGDNPVFRKGHEVSESIRERWETSDSPLVHRIQARCTPVDGVLLASHTRGARVRAHVCMQLCGSHGGVAGGCHSETSRPDGLATPPSLPPGLPTVLASLAGRCGQPAGRRGAGAGSSLTSFPPPLTSADVSPWTLLRPAGRGGQPADGG